MKNELYELIKKTNQEKNRPLRIVCDWDEVIQNHFSLVVWKMSGEKEGIKFEDFYENYWQKEGGYEGWADFADKYQIYFGDGKAKYKEARKSVISDDNPPFISLADELLTCLKEGLIEEVVFLSGYNQKEPEHEVQKNEAFAATFGQFPKEKARMVTVPLDPVTQKADKWTWMKDNYSEFDIFIDDRSDYVSNVREIFPDRIYAMPSFFHNGYWEELGWKKFKKWLDENVIEERESQIFIKADKQDEYSELSNSALNDFYNSLKATVNKDKEGDFRLLPKFKATKLFSPEAILGNKNNQELTSENDYNLLAKLFDGYKLSKTVKENEAYRVSSEVCSNKNEFGEKVGKTLQEIKVTEEVTQQFEAKVVVSSDSNK